MALAIECDRLISDGVIKNPWGQKTQPSTKRFKKATSKRLTGMHLSRTDVLSTAVIVLRSF